MKIAPLSVSRPSRPAPPNFQGKGNSIVLKHSELVTTITGKNAFTVGTSLPINPALPHTFPWLSSIAKSWEQYRVHAMSFEYIPRVAATTSGAVMMALDYDVYDDPPATEAELMAYQGAVETPVWTGLRMFADVNAIHRISPRKFTRNDIMVGDARVADACRLIVATAGVTDDLVIGKVRIHYTIELFVPQTVPSMPVSQTAAMFANDSAQNLADGVAAPILFPDTIVNNLGITQNKPTGEFTLPAGLWKVEASASTLFEDAGSPTIELSMRKDGADTLQRTYNHTSTPAAAQIASDFNAIVESTGLEKWQVFILAGFVAGTASLIARCQRLIFTRLNRFPVT